MEENQNQDFGFSGDGEILKTIGVIVAQVAPVPIDSQRAEEERRLEKKFGHSAFGDRIPAKYFDAYPDDTQAKPVLTD